MACPQLCQHGKWTEALPAWRGLQFKPVELFWKSRRVVSTVDGVLKEGGGLAGPGLFFGGGASWGIPLLRHMAASPQGAHKTLPRAFCVDFGTPSRGLARQLPAILWLSGYAWDGFWLVYLPPALA